MILQKQTVKPIETADASHIHALLGKPTAEICDHSVGNIYMWKDTLDTDLVGDGPLCLAEHYEGETYFAMRYSDGNYVERVKALVEQFGMPLHLCSMTENEVGALRDAFGDRFSCEGEDGAADYLYDAAALRTFAGKKYHAQKNHLNAFLRNYAHYTFLPYKPEEEAELLAFFDRYEAEAADPSDSAKKESLACRRLIPMLHALSLDARMLRVDGVLCGFAVMEAVGDTLMIHIEKGLTSYRGVYPMLVHLEASAYPHIRYINREEDDGNEGLRRSKKSYNPIELKQKYIGCIE